MLKHKHSTLLLNKPQMTSMNTIFVWWH